MARDTTAYAAVPPGSQYVEGVVGVPVSPPNNAITLNGQQEWWREPDPVNSCCFCCHLEGGIIILAGLKTAANAILLLLFPLFANPEQNALEATHEQYMTECKSNPPTLSYDDCRQLEQNIDDLQNSLSEQHMSVAVSFYGYFTVFCLVVGLAGGVAGLWAVCGRSTFAAKLFFLSWPTSLVLGIVSLIVKSVMIEELNPYDPSPFDFTPSIFTLFYIHFTKASWYYYTVLKTRDTSASSGIESDIEHRGIEG